MFSNEAAIVDSLAGQVSSAIYSMLETHSRGLQTTIFADQAVLQSINASIPGGLLAVLASSTGDRVYARNIKQLEDIKEPVSSSATVLPNGEHALILVGTTSWSSPAGKVWTAIKNALQQGSFTSCTLCVTTREEQWHEVSATTNTLQTEAEVRQALLDYLGLQHSTVNLVTVPLLAVTPLCGNTFVLPGDTDEQQMEWVSLGLVSLLDNLELRGDFYSLGDTSRRVAHRCAGITSRTAGAQKSNDQSAPGMATVVILDRMLDMVPVVHHGHHLLDQCYRAIPEKSGQMEILSLLRSSQPTEDGLSLDLWETMFEQAKPVALQIIRRSLVNYLAKIDGTDGGTLPSTIGAVTTKQLQEIVDIYKVQSVDVSEQVQYMLDIAQLVIKMESIAEKERWKEIESIEKTLKLIIGGIRRSSMEKDEEELEMSMVWDQVLSAIPPARTPDTKPNALTDDNEVESMVWKYSAAPSLVIMAASLVCCSVGIPASQRTLIEQRLIKDYQQISQRMNIFEIKASANHWADRVMALADRLAISKEGLIAEEDGIYEPLIPRIAERVVLQGDGGFRNSMLEHAEQHGRTAANLLKGLGRKFLAAGKTEMAPSSISTDQLRQQNPTVVVFVVGGMSFEEAAKISQLSSDTGRTVLVGSTGMGQRYITS